MFSNELERRYSNEIEVIAMHPGVVATNSFREYPEWFAGFLNRFLEKPESASKKIYEVVDSERVESGYYNQNQSMGSIYQYIDKEKSTDLFAFSQKYLL